MCDKKLGLPVTPRFILHKLKKAQTLSKASQKKLYKVTKSTFLTPHTSQINLTSESQSGSTVL